MSREDPSQIDHIGLVAEVKDKLPTEPTITAMTSMLKMFADGTRAKILFALYESELRVYDIADILEMSQSSVSHQLRLLKQSKLVKSRKEGKEVYYSLADDHVINIFSQSLAHASEKPQ
ncbi:hypothetical protein FD09_GL002393 [Schleiferilactobacillus perolens DSM 12744]|jgi:ArsR family transcriptional regulator|uniref:HTH arsR-type domain-containing protein n=2 Tax=Schleiferilactobacillus perolens TaxID=100468 RepID=A0A0R1MXG0_9LACO|nr:hypothetical protein FD09_GL002393 [Schleiferilactobacillus perolens DSM 12744]